MAAPPALADVLELNVGGQVYYTRRVTLAESASPLLARLFSSTCTSSNDLARDQRGRYFIDRDGFLFRYVLDFLRDQQVVLPDRFPERRRLRREAEYYQLPALAALLSDEREHEKEGSSQGSDPPPHLPPTPFFLPHDRRSGFLTVACRGGGCGARSRRSPPRRLAVSGHLALAREVFAEALEEEEEREPQRSPERYKTRLHLRFPYLERAFDLLAERGFRLVGCNSASTAPRLPGREEQDEAEEEEREEERNRWSSYTEYIFYRE